MEPLPATLRKVLRSAYVRQVPSGQIILYEGDIAREVFVLKSGIVKIYDIDENGNEKILHLVKSPAVIPFAFFSGTRESMRWFYASLTDCELYVLSAAALKTMTREDNKLAELLTNGFSKDVHELLVRLSSMGKTNTQDKVIAVLQFLLARHATQQRKGNWWRVTFPLNHQLVADLSGITRESTALVMKNLQDKGVIRSPKQMVLEINKAKLST